MQRKSANLTKVRLKLVTIDRLRLFLKMTGSSRKHLGIIVQTLAVLGSFSAKRENFQKVGVLISK
jgi:hypothetical protein